MSISVRNFSNFYLGDNVYELADGVIPEIAERLDVALGQEPNSTDLQEVMAKVGQNKVLRNNEEVTAMDRMTMAELLQISGVQEALDRSLWSPDIIAHLEVDTIITMGGVANWQDRTADRLGVSFMSFPVHLLGGNREMNSPTEVSNPNVEGIVHDFQRLPSEAEYVASIIAPMMRNIGHRVLVSTFDTGDGDEILSKFFEKNQHLLDKRIALARVANAGVPMAIQMRDAARRFNSDFDTNPHNPQTYIITDSFPVSTTQEQDNQPAKYQKAATGLRQLVLTAKKLHEASGGE